MMMMIVHIRLQLFQRCLLPCESSSGVLLSALVHVETGNGDPRLLERAGT